MFLKLLRVEKMFDM